MVQVVMRYFALAFMVAFATASFGQILRQENFDGLADGNPAGSNSWTASTAGWVVRPGGGAFPTATSGSKIVTCAGPQDLLYNAIATEWANRTPGNDIIRAEVDVYVQPDEINGRSLTFGVSNTVGTGFAVLRFDTTPNAWSASSAFIGGLTGPTTPRGQWHRVQIEIDMIGLKAFFWIGETSVGVLDVASSASIARITLGTSKSSAATPKNIAFDSMLVQAVPTGTISVTFDVSALSGSYVPLASNYEIQTIEGGIVTETKTVTSHPTTGRLTMRTKAFGSPTFRIRPLQTGSQLPTFLAQSVSASLPRTGTVSIPVVIVNGDANQDNSVDLLDYFALSDSYALSTGDVGINPAADFNKDESVDLLDYFILSDGYGIQGAE